MTGKELGNQPASPVPAFQSIKGLTKREAFAMAAMQGLMADQTVQSGPKLMAEVSVEYADALLEELAKGSQ